MLTGYPPYHVKKSGDNEDSDSDDDVHNIQFKRKDDGDKKKTERHPNESIRGVKLSYLLPGIHTLGEAILESQEATNDEGSKKRLNSQKQKATDKQSAKGGNSFVTIVSRFFTGKKQITGKQPDAKEVSEKSFREENPLEGLDETSVLQKLLRGELPSYELPVNSSSDVIKFLSRCFREKRKERPSASELLLDPFIQG